MADNNFTIRRAISSDCPAMLSLIRELAVFERAPEEVTVTLEHFEESGFGKTPVWWAFVAEDSQTSKVVAFALYYVRYSTWKGTRMYLEDILVTEAYRGKGIGGQLMDMLIIEAKERQFHGISWQVLDWNDTAIRFYKKYNARFDAGWINVAIDV